MLAQTETKSKGQFGNHNGRTDKSDGLDPQFNKLKNDLSLALREIFKSQETTTPSQGEHHEGTCRAQFQEFAKAKFARIQPTIQKKTSQFDVEPRPTRTRAGQVITRTHQRLIDTAIDSLQEDDQSGLPDLETDDDE